MTPENGPQPNLLRLASELRISQRLGQISANTATRNHLHPSIASHGSEEHTPQSVIDMLSNEMRSFATEHQMGLDQLLLNRMPAYIRAVVGAEKDEEKVASLWEDIIADQKVIDNQQEVMAYREKWHKATPGSRNRFHKPSKRKRF